MRKLTGQIPVMSYFDTLWKKQAYIHSTNQLTKVQSQMKEMKIKEGIVKKEPLTSAEEAFDKLTVDPSTPAKGEEKKEKNNRPDSRRQP